jgi:hypothetical protein
MTSNGNLSSRLDRPAADPARPWYRHRWPWILMAGPAAVVIAGAVTVWLAVKSNDGLVAEDYYKKGLTINQSLEKAEQARALGLSAQLKIVAGRVDATLRSERSAALPERIVVALSHPTRAGMDQSVLLNTSEPGRYGGNLAALAAGRWRITIADQAQSWQLSGTMRVPDETDITLVPAERLGQ